MSAMNQVRASGIWEFRVSGGVADSGSFHNHAFAKQTKACYQTSKSCSFMS